MNGYKTPTCMSYTVATTLLCSSPNSFNLGGGGNYSPEVIYDNGEY